MPNVIFGWIFVDLGLILGQQNTMKAMAMAIIHFSKKIQIEDRNLSLFVYILLR
jgi:hypothetical protein